MQRAIKFRAWRDGGFDYSFGEEEHFWALHSLSPNEEIQQFTGLTDKNGKEIYEGDIVSVNGENIVVKWSRNSMFHLNGFDGPLGGSWVSRFSVIGNIYENPELLK